MRYRKIVPYLFILPMVVGLVVFRFGPIAASLLASFTRWSVYAPPQWLGLGNYQEMLTSSEFWTVLTNTLIFTIAYVPGVVILALIMALLVNQKLRGITLFRGLYFMPYITSMVAVAMVWNWIFSTRFGLVNYVLKELFNVNSPPAWLADRHYTLFVLILVSTWKTAGFQMLIFLAGLQDIPRELYEAARVDGADGRQIFFSITLPLLSPVTFFVIVNSIINAFRTFEVTYAMTQDKPSYAPTLAYNIYQNAFIFFRMGYASALAYVLLLLVGFVTFINFLLKRRWVFYRA